METQELMVINRLGQRVPLMFSAFPIKDEKGPVLGEVIIFRDLTPIKRLEKERRHLVNMWPMI